MELAETKLMHLTGYIKKDVEPCFPPYYNIYEILKQIYLESIYDHLMEHHMPNMETYMQPSVLDVDNTSAEIFLDFYIFLNAMKEIL